MRKSLAIIVVGTVLALAAPAGLYAAEAAASTSGATFELTYRGLDTPDDPLSYRSYWGFGGQDKDTPFIIDVKQHVEKYNVVYNAMLSGDMQWSLVELKDSKPVAFYFDVNADGKFSDNEKISPAPHGDNFGYECAFVTPDFMIRTKDQKEVPFRVMLVGYKGGDNISYMWSPCCVLEGQATLAGVPMKMVMYADGFSGSFSTFRRCSVSLVPAADKVENYVPRQNLSSLICYQDTFYRVKLNGAFAKGEKLSVQLDKDTTPTGKIGIELAGLESGKSTLNSANIEGSKDSSIYFSVGSNRTTFPVGAYRLLSGYLNLEDGDDAWLVQFSEGPEFDITADATSTIKLGEPKLTVNVIREEDRYRGDVKATTTFAKGTALYITPEVKGMAGEIYTRTMKKASGSNQFENVKPHLTIKDADGKEIASADLEYG